MGRGAMLLGFIICVALAGCAEEKGLPERPQDGETKTSSNPLEPPKPEKEDPAARAIVNDAIAAHTGGKPERLEKFKKHHMVLKGQIANTGGETPVTHVRESWAVWPDSYAFRFDVQDRTTFAGAATAAEGFRRIDSKTVNPLPPLLHKACLIDCSALDWGGTVASLSNPKAIYHKPGTVTANGKTFRTVKCWTPGLPEWTLWFDDATKLLEQIHYEGLEESLIKSKSLMLGKHAEHEGVKVPREIGLSIGGSRMFDWSVEKFETPESIDAKTFTDPPQPK